MLRVETDLCWLFLHHVLKHRRFQIASIARMSPVQLLLLFLPGNLQCIDQVFSSPPVQPTTSVTHAFSMRVAWYTHRNVLAVDHHDCISRHQ